MHASEAARLGAAIPSLGLVHPSESARLGERASRRKHQRPSARDSIPTAAASWARTQAGAFDPTWQYNPALTAASTRATRHPAGRLHPCDRAANGPPSEHAILRGCSGRVGSPWTAARARCPLAACARTRRPHTPSIRPRRVAASALPHRSLAHAPRTSCTSRTRHMPCACRALCAHNPRATTRDARASRAVFTPPALRAPARRPSLDLGDRAREHNDPKFGPNFVYERPQVRCPSPLCRNSGGGAAKRCSCN